MIAPATTADPIRVCLSRRMKRHSVAKAALAATDISGSRLADGRADAGGFLAGFMIGILPDRATPQCGQKAVSRSITPLHCGHFIWR